MATAATFLTAASAPALLQGLPGGQASGRRDHDSRDAVLSHNKIHATKNQINPAAEVTQESWVNLREMEHGQRSRKN